MHRLLLFVTLALVLALVTPAAQAQKQAPGRPDQQQVRDVPQRGAPERDAAIEREEREREAAEKRADAARDEAEEIAERERDMAEEHDREQAKQGLRDTDESASRGNEKSQEMRTRRDERKEIMGDYRGDEHMKAEAGADGTDENANAEEKKGKKPWWKFWGD